MGGEPILPRHHSRLIMTLVRCLRLSFTGCSPVTDGDAQYADVAGTGEAQKSGQGNFACLGAILDCLFTAFF